jgi:general L-amino acid transport system permease protein
MTRAEGLLRALFGSWLNAAISVAMLALFAYLVPIVWTWAVAAATFAGASRADCSPGGACWAFVAAKLQLFLYGNFPSGAEWRVHVALAILLICLAGAVLHAERRREWILALACSVPVNALLLTGGFAGLTYVRTSDWGGLTLNITLAFIAIGLSIPCGIVLAFTRRSKNRKLAWLATLFIEFWRSVPLLAVLFMGVVMLPLFLPPNVSIDNLLRALIVLVLFTSAYMAEVFRGALQALPHGQEEAAAALGMRPVAIAALVMLPQSMRIAVPGIVNIAVDLFKDTSLVSIVGLFDLVGASTQAIKDPAWLGMTTESYLFTAALFFVCCLAISLCGQFIERHLAAPYLPRRGSVRVKPAELAAE